MAVSRDFTERPINTQAARGCRIKARCHPAATDAGPDGSGTTSA